MFGLSSPPSFLLLFRIILALTQSVVPDPNLSSAAGLSCLVVFGVLCLIVFCLWEQYVAKNPIIKLSIWTNRIFTASTIAQVFASFARGNVTCMLPFFFPYFLFVLAFV